MTGFQSNRVCRCFLCIFTAWYKMKFFSNQIAASSFCYLNFQLPRGLEFSFSKSVINLMGTFSGFTAINN